MPKFRIKVEQTLRVWEIGSHYIEADSLEAARAWAENADAPREMKEVGGDCEDTDFTIEPLPDDTPIDCEVI
jgi:hypothetical protein